MVCGRQEADVFVSGSVLQAGRQARPLTGISANPHPE